MSSFQQRVIFSCAAIGFSIAALTGSAIAQTASAPQQDGQRSEQWQQKRMEQMQKHHTALHDSLKLTVAQEPAWKTFTDKTKPQGKMTRPSREDMAKLSAPERMERQLAMMQEHQARMSTHLAALKEFYAVLTPAQKKIMDEQTMKHHSRGDHHHRGNHHDKTAA